MLPIDKISISISNTSKTYADGTQGLKPTELHVEAGETLALLGPSGCGKTTLLRLIAGLETADPGSKIFFDDADVTHLPAEQRHIGMVFQSYALFPQMSVQANISYGLTIRGIDKSVIKQRVGELIDLVHLHGLEHKRPSELSGGQRQRVALARAIAVQPRVLLLDEPLAALDAKLKISLRSELADLLRQLGITTVHVTHDQQEAFAIADRLAIMYGGQIMQIGTGETLYRNPQHSFVAEFLGRVNRIERDQHAIQNQLLNLGGTQFACPEHLTKSPSLFLRPEDIEVGSININGLNATIIQRTFLGEHIELQLELADKTRLIAETHNYCPYQQGDKVGLTIPFSRFLNP